MTDTIIANVESHARKSERLEMRMTPAQRRKVEHAAALSGMALSQWATSSLIASADREIEDATITRIPDQYFDAFIAALDEPLPEVTRQLLEEPEIWK